MVSRTFAGFWASSFCATAAGMSRIRSRRICFRFFKESGIYYFYGAKCNANLLKRAGNYSFPEER
jgi:hypothetical protein